MKLLQKEVELRSLQVMKESIKQSAKNSTKKIEEEFAKEKFNVNSEMEKTEFDKDTKAYFDNNQHCASKLLKSAMELPLNV